MATDYICRLTARIFFSDAHPALQVLCQHSEKTTGCSTLYSFFYCQRQGSHPVTVLDQYSEHYPCSFIRVVGSLAIAPAVTVVRLLDTNGHTFHLPSPNMRALHYLTKVGISMTELRATILSSKVLTHLTLSFKGHGRIGTSVSYLPSLEELDIDFNCLKHKWFINNIITMSITRLIIRNGKVTITSSLHRLLHRYLSLAGG